MADKLRTIEIKLLNAENEEQHVHANSAGLIGGGNGLQSVSILITDTSQSSTNNTPNYMPIQTTSASASAKLDNDKITIQPYSSVQVTDVTTNSSYSPIKVTVTPSTDYVSTEPHSLRHER